MAFFSSASNLVAGDVNAGQDVFLHDRSTGQTTLASVSSSGEQGNDRIHALAIAAEGRAVAFLSLADNLVPGDTNGIADVFLHDRSLGRPYCFGDGTGTTCPCGSGFNLTSGIELRFEA